MTHNGGMYQIIQKVRMETIQVTTQVPCLKQSSGMVSSNNTRKMIINNHNKKVSWIELEVSMVMVFTQANELV